MLLCIVVYCLRFVFCCCNKTIMETNMGRKGVYLTSRVTVHHWGKSAGIRSRTLKAGTKADRHHGGALLNGLLSLFSYSHTKLPAHGWHHPLLAGPLHCNQCPKKCPPPDLPTSQSLDMFTQLRVPLPIDPSLCQLDKNQTTHRIFMLWKHQITKKNQMWFYITISSKKEEGFLQKPLGHLLFSALQSPTSFWQILELQDWVPVL